LNRSRKITGEGMNGLGAGLKALVSLKTLDINFYEQKT